jgi:hypothetical protein
VFLRSLERSQRSGYDKLRSLVWRIFNVEDRAKLREGSLEFLGNALGVHIEWEGFDNAFHCEQAAEQGIVGSYGLISAHQ